MNTQRSGAVAVVALLLCVTLIGCGSRQDRRADLTADALSTIPASAIGVIGIGPSQPPFDPTLDTTTLYFFDDHGTELGTLREPAIENAMLAVQPGTITVASADAVTVLTEQDIGQIPLPMSESLVETVVLGHSGKRIIWFNTGYTVDGYSNNYVEFDGSNEAPATGTVPGAVLASGFCKDTNYSIVEDVESVSWDGPARSWLYRIEPGAEPRRISEWTSDNGFRPLSRTAVCDEIGRLHVLYGSTGTRADPAAEGPTLTVLDTRIPSDPVNFLLDSSYTWRTPSGAVALRDGKLIWVTSDGDVVRAAASQSAVVEWLWAIPAAVESEAVSLSPDGETVTSVHRAASGHFHYAVFDAVTGSALAGPIPLPWLDKLVDTVTESGQSTYRVTDVESVQ